MEKDDIEIQNIIQNMTSLNETQSTIGFKILKCHKISEMIEFYQNEVQKYGEVQTKFDEFKLNSTYIKTKRETRARSDGNVLPLLKLQKLFSQNSYNIKKFNQSKSRAQAPFFFP